MSPIARMVVVRRGPGYWLQFRGDLRENLVRIWPFWLAFLVVWMGSAGIFRWLEANKGSELIHSFGDSVYYTLMTMLTAGYLAPVTAAGRIFAALDAIFGLIFLGVIVWLVTSSLEPDSPSPLLPSEAPPPLVPWDGPVPPFPPS